MIPPLDQLLQIASPGGHVGPAFHRWLQEVERALRGPFIGQQRPRSFTIFDGEYGVHGKRLELDTGDRATILGSGRLVICG